MNADSIITFLVWLWTLDGVRFIAGHTVLNLVVAVAAALRTGEFQPYKLAEFLRKKLAPYVLIYGVIKALSVEAQSPDGHLLGIGLQGFDWLAASSFALIEISLAADLAENLAALGVPMPDSIKRLVVKQQLDL